MKNEMKIETGAAQTTETVEAPRATPLFAMGLGHASVKTHVKAGRKQEQAEK